MKRVRFIEQRGSTSELLGYANLNQVATGHTYSLGNGNAKVIAVLDSTDSEVIVQAIRV